LKYLDAFLRDRQPTVQNEKTYSEVPSKPSKPCSDGVLDECATNQCPPEEGFEGFEGSRNQESSKQTVGCSHPQNLQNPDADSPDIALKVFLDLLDYNDKTFPDFESLPGVADLDVARHANEIYKPSPAGRDQPRRPITKKKTISKIRALFAGDPTTCPPT